MVLASSARLAMVEVNPVSLPSEDLGFPGVRGPRRGAVHDAPSVWSPFPAVDVLTVRVEDRTDEITHALVARLDIGAADGGVSVDIDDDAAEKVLGSTAPLEVAL